MAKIQPVVFPLNAGTATELSVLILNFPTDATTCTTYYELKSEVIEERTEVTETTEVTEVTETTEVTKVISSTPAKLLSNGNYTLTEAEFAAWGEDNTWVETCVANAIGVTILTF